MMPKFCIVCGKSHIGPHFKKNRAMWKDVIVHVDKTQCGE
jgi:hypothetical protein